MNLDKEMGTPDVINLFEAREKWNLYLPIVLPS